MNKKIIAMRKALLLIGFCVLAISASAQNTALKVQSNGKIAIHTDTTVKSPITINGEGKTGYYMFCNTGEKSGIYLTVSGGTGLGVTYGGLFKILYQGSSNYGFKGYAEAADYNIGVMGSGGAGWKSIGLLGSIDQNNNSCGAGVYGTTIINDTGSLIPSNEKYAGFFRGNVKVTGNFSAGTILRGALLGESSSSSGSSASGLSLRGASIASSLSGLNVTTYQKERPEMPEIIETIHDDIDGETTQRGEEPEPDIMDEQFYDKTHYALDADRLEETFPDLVYVNKDGSKVINYVEMIPLLVQSINELREEIDVLKGQTSEGTAKKTRSETNKQALSRSQNRLYQNTPNPFKEQTQIRFSLADDVQDAAICIFDMTGKTIKKLPISSGMESVSIGGYELGEGMFLYSLVVNGQEIDTKRMIVSK
jgi:hypothetical protein